MFETLVVVKPVKKFRTFCVTITAALHWTSSASKFCVHPPPYYSEIIFPIVISSVCRYSKGSSLSLSFMTKILCSCFVLAVIYDTKGKFLIHMFRCHVADIANSTLFFFPFVCGSHFRLHSLVLSLAYIRITNVHTFCYSVWSPCHAVATVEAHVRPQASPCGICG